MVVLARLTHGNSETHDIKGSPTTFYIIESIGSASLKRFGAERNVCILELSAPFESA